MKKLSCIRGGRIAAIIMAAVISFSSYGCGSTGGSGTDASGDTESTSINIEEREDEGDSEALENGEGESEDSTQQNISSDADTNDSSAKTSGTQAAEGTETSGTQAAKGTETSNSQAAEDAEITIVNHDVSSSVEGTVMATGIYSEIKLSDELSDEYPKLKETMDSFNESWKGMVESDVATYAVWASEENADNDISYASEKTAQIVRVDDRIFSIILNYYEYSGGAHPNHGSLSINIDPVTGNLYELSNVLKDSTGLSQAIRDKLDEGYPGCLEEIDEYHYGEGEVFADKLLEDSYTWSVTDEGLNLYFSPYEIASYATGYLEVVLPYDEYPDLIQNAFKVTEKQDIESLVAETEGEGVEVEPQEESALFDMITIANPTWEKYCSAEDTHEDATFISLTQTKEDKSDWLDSEVWASENGFDVVYLPYSDGTYYYRPEMAIEYDYMYNELMIMSDDQETVLYDYDLSVLGNGPDEKDGKYSGTTQYIRWAQVVDDVVYVSIGHNGYATEEPLSNYMVAIDLNTNEVIWRSEPCVSNARNFKIVGDTIICGYGFTAEPDYIYLLNRYTGDVVSSIKVNSAPEQFEIVDDTLYVATYNTAYEYKIN